MSEWVLASATFAFGAASSLHCAVMCGPLAACFASGAGPSVAYQGARIASYSILGAAAGALGTILPQSAGSALSRVVPLVGALAFVLVMTGGARLAATRRAVPAPLRALASRARNALSGNA